MLTKNSIFYGKNNLSLTAWFGAEEEKKNSVTLALCKNVAFLPLWGEIFRLAWLSFLIIIFIY